MVEIEDETRYETLKRIDLVKLVRRGILSVHLLDYITFYESFLKDYEITNRKYQSYENVAEDYKVSFDTIRNAVKYMKS